MNTASTLSIAAIAATLAFAAPASAQVVNFQGVASGCFFTGSVCTPTGANNTVGPLTYMGSTFNVTSSAGFAAINDVPAALNLNNLGSFSLPSGGASFTPSGNNFLLNVAFTAPVGSVPSGSNFLAALSGDVSTTNTGGLFINFDNTPKLFTYAGGTFTLTVQDVSITNAAGVNVVPVGGFINVASTVVPEPSTYALMAAGLAGVFFAGRRRRAV